MKKLFEIDKLMAKSLTKQICDGYRAAIADGRLAGGERFLDADNFHNQNI